MCRIMCFVKSSFNWASAASPTLGCSIKILSDIYVYVCRYVGLSTILWETHTKKLYIKMCGRNYIIQTRACSKSVLGV